MKETESKQQRQGHKRKPESKQIGRKGNESKKKADKERR